MGEGTRDRAVAARAQVPGAVRAMRAVRLQAAAPGPLPAAQIARELGLPRSTTYHLLAALEAEGFVVHLPEERRYSLGLGAFEIGTAYTRQGPLQRLARPLLARLVDTVHENAHLAVMHGREVLYLVEERAPGRPPLITDVGVRLPAQLTASGRAMLAVLPAAQVRALFADPAAFVQRGGGGPATLSQLRALLRQARAEGVAYEDGEVTPGFASVAAAARENTGLPLAAVAITFEQDRVSPGRRKALAQAAVRTAGALERRLHVRPAARS
jgi:DNA-binding IclR family transcriptional regulator